MSSDEPKSKEENDNTEEKKVQLNGGTVHDDDDDEDDMPLSSLKTKRASVTKPSYRDLSEDDDDDDDNVPLISLVAKGSTKPNADTTSPKKKASSSKKEVTAKKAAATKAKTKSPAAKKKVITKASKESASPKKKKASVASTSTSISSSNKTYEWVSAALYGSNFEKGLLIQRFLCRWWYAVTWPDRAHPVRPVPDASQYDTLDGFPGVYIGTAPEVVGEIYDTRDLSTAPTFRNLVSKPSAELQELLIRAIEEQKRQLVATLENSEEDGGKVSTDTTLKDLEGMLKWARKLNPIKADKDAIAVLKAHGLKL
jgi:hypothetical protein